MKSNKLQDAVGLVRDDFVKDAEYQVERQAKVYPWVKWVAAAACLGVAVLIAVPALNGKTPEVEPVEPTPVEEPAVEPADKPRAEAANDPEVEPADEPVSNPTTSDSTIHLATIRLASNEEFEESTNINVNLAADVSSITSGVAGGVADGSYTYEDYLRDYEAVTANPVFAALFASEVAQPFDIIGVAAWSNTQCAELAVDGFSKTYVESAVDIIHNGDYPEDTDSMFANDTGVVTSYMVDGIEIQKYYERDAWEAMGFDTADEPIPNPDNDPEIAWINFTERMEYTYWERVSVAGEWYLVYGTDEAEVDAIASALAHIASQI